MLAVERAVFRTLEELAADYRGGYWHFYDLSNGGFYMAPDLDSLRVQIQGNEFCAVMSADAAGIVACLFAYSRLSVTHRSDVLAVHYHRLQDFARDHPEAEHIMRAEVLADEVLSVRSGRGACHGGWRRPRRNRATRAEPATDLT
jgi:hypothetical protein